MVGIHLGEYRIMSVISLIQVFMSEFFSLRLMTMGI
jgi:hypothetical protein